MLFIIYRIDTKTKEKHYWTGKRWVGCCDVRAYRSWNVAASVMRKIYDRSRLTCTVGDTHDIQEWRLGVEEFCSSKIFRNPNYVWIDHPTPPKPIQPEPLHLFDEEKPEPTFTPMGA